MIFVCLAVALVAAVAFACINDEPFDLYNDDATKGTNNGNR